ncbi:hypothetical protein Tco_0178413 [Tanacetum coccineum]
MLDPSPNLLVHGERLEIRDYQLCAIWKNLGYSEWSTPAGLKLARENLQSRVKEEDSITDVENAIFDLGVMDSLCFLFIDQRVFIGMITKFIKFIELNFSVITRGFDIKVCMLKGPAQRASSNLSDQAARFSPTVLSRILFQHDIVPQLAHFLCGDKRWRDDESTPFLSMTFANWSLLKNAFPRSLFMARGGHRIWRESFEYLKTTSGIIGGSALAQPILTSSRRPRVYICSLEKTGMAP